MNSACQIEPTKSVEGRESLASSGFLGLLATQFLGALNDNMFRWLVVPIGKYYAGPEHTATVLSAGLACFVLPYILLAGPAGYLADRFSKRTVIVACKIAEIAIVLSGVLAIACGSVPLMFVVLALIGSQSALFGPAKMASLPEMLPAGKLSSANGLMGLVTVAAIVLGSLAGNYLYSWTGPDGRSHLEVAAIILIGTAVVGTATSLLIRRFPAANPGKAFPLNPVREAYSELRVLASQRSLALAAVGSAFFWSLASLSQLNVDRFGMLELGLAQQQIGPLLAVMALGVAFGSVLAGWLSSGRVELGFVPFGAVAIGTGALAMAASSSSYGASLVALFCMGAGAGMFDVPLQSLLQAKSPAASRGAILAASNFLTFSGTLACAGVFWLLSEPLGLSPRQIFLLAGGTMIPVLLLACKLVPADTLRLLVRLVARLIYRVDVRGHEYIPAEGGALLVANHVSWVDAILLSLHTNRQVRMVGYADYFQRWPWKWIADQARIIPIKPGGGRRSILASLTQARNAVADGELVCIFPEGAITRDGQVADFKPGFLSILRGTGAKVIPIYLDGLWGSMFSYRGGESFLKWPRRWPFPVAIRYGRPIDSPRDVEEVRDAVIRLGPPAGSITASTASAPRRSPAARLAIVSTAGSEC